MTCSSLVPAYSVGFGWCRVTSQVCRARSSRAACSSGMCFAMAWATARSMRVTPTVCSRGARTRSTWAAAFRLRAWVFWAIRRPRQAGTSSVWRRRQVCGSRWTRSRASASRVLAVSVETPEGEAEGFGCERGHQRGALPAEGLVGVQVAVAAPHGDAGVGGGRVQDAPLVGELELAEVGLAADSFVVADGGEQRVGSEVVDPGPVGGGCCSWVYSSTRHRQSKGLRSPCPQGESKKFSTTVTTAVDPKQP